jgi:hypothetical protein
MKEIHQFETLEPGETIYLIFTDSGLKLKEIKLTDRHFDTIDQKPIYTNYTSIGNVNKAYYLPLDQKYFQSDGPNAPKMFRYSSSEKLQQIVYLTDELTPNVFFINKDLAQEYLKKLHHQAIYEAYVIDYIDQIHVAFLQNVQTGEISNFVSDTNQIKELIDKYQQMLIQESPILEKFHAFTKSGIDLGFKPFIQTQL